MRYAGVIAAVVLSSSFAEAMIDKNIIRRGIRAQLPKVRACYERALDKDPRLEGTVQVRFTILRDGTVADAHASGMPPIDKCVERIVGAIVFPRPPGSVLVTYPFTFRPAD